MKKKKSTFESWDEVSIALKELAETKALMHRMEAKMNSEIEHIKEKYAEETGVYMKTAAEKEQNILLFVEENKKEFSQVKSREFTFGRVGMRKSTEIVTRNIKAIMEALKLHGMEDCITVRENINKEVLRTYPDEDIEKVGAHRKSGEKPFVEVSWEKLKE